MGRFDSGLGTIRDLEVDVLKRICIFYDGTWNRRDSHTNVSVARDRVRSEGPRDPQQPVFYDEGVGTRWYDRVRGGLFGFGLSRNIRQGWRWLAEVYRPGDEIYVFGFSRGAYTARSLVGLIRKCGVLKDPSPELARRAYKEVYRDKSLHPDAPAAAAFRAQYAHADRTRVRFIGVWDTVGSLGIPGGLRLPFSRGYYDWHDTELSSIVDRAYHAVAIDEHRKDFPPTLWSSVKPDNEEVEQVWFPGAHANVGGGYDGDALCRVPLHWMLAKAQAAGLELRANPEPGPRDHLAPVADSYGGFLFGLYKHLRRKLIRGYGAAAAESLHPRVVDRMQEDAAYRPPTLEKLWP